MGRSFRKAEDFSLDSVWANRALIPWTDVLPNCLAVGDMLEGEPRFRRYLPGYRPWLIGKLRHFAGAGDDL